MLRPHNLFYEKGSSFVLSFIHSFIDPFLGGVKPEIDTTRALTEANDNIGGKANVINILQQESKKGNVTAIRADHSNHSP